jgi:hypothetical protein
MAHRALILALAIVAAWTTEADSLGLSSEQLQRLDRGDIVLRNTLPPGGAGRRAWGGTGIAVVHASADTAWQVLTDFAGHRGLYPRVVVAEVLETGAEHALVRYVVGVGPLSFGFHVHNYPDASRRRLEGAWPRTGPTTSSTTAGGTGRSSRAGAMCS